MQEEWKIIEGFEDYEISNLGRVKRVIPDKWNHKCKILEQHFDKTNYIYVNLTKNNITKHKYIHRLMFKTFIGLIPKGYVIHHIDFIKDNNFLENFQLMTRGEHSSIHTKGENNPMFGVSLHRYGKDAPFYGNHHAEKTKKLISEANIGKIVSDSTKHKISISSKGKKHTQEQNKRQSLMMKKRIKNGEFIIKSGENNPVSKFKNKDIIEIRKSYGEGILTQTKIAKKFNVSISTISEIVNFKRYKDVS